VLGVAAGAAALLGLPAEKIMRAVDIAACQLSASLYLPIRTGRNVRSIYLAHSAAQGFDAALAAHAGIDAPPDALAYYAQHYCPAATDAPPPPAQDLILDGYLKPFAAVRHVHYGAIAAGRIRAQMGGDSRAITAIELIIYEEATVYCGNPQPQTLLAAQFSLTFGVAAMLRLGALDAHVYREPQFSDAELRRLEALVRVRVDPGLTAKKQRGGTLRVAAATGQVYEATVAWDDPALLLDAQAMIAKFAQGAVPALDEAASRRFCEAILSADNATPLTTLWPFQ
jgi:2-methylcitrate dehydratase PrpD